MFRRKFLVIAPDNAQLPKTNIEISALRRYHDIKVLAGEVREHDIAQALAETDDYDGVWFITHSNSDGIMLSEGMLSSDAVVQYAKTYPFELIVFNTCESEDIALQVNSEAQISVICTIASIDNQDAIRFGSLLAKELSFVDEIGEAFSIVNTDSGDYRYYSPLTVLRGRDAGALNQMIERFNSLERLVVGEYGQNGLLHRIAALERFLPLLQSISNRMDGTRTIPNQTFNVISAVIVIAIIVLAFLLYTASTGGV